MKNKQSGMAAMVLSALLVSALWSQAGAEKWMVVRSRLVFVRGRLFCASGKTATSIRIQDTVFA